MLQRWTKADLATMGKRERAKFVNGLSGAKSGNLLGTVDGQGRSNLSMVSSCVHLGANPALMGMVIRPRSVPRHSFDNLVETGCWTLNHIHRDIAKQAHQTSARYPKEVSEFAAVGLTEEFVEGIIAPFVKESRLKMSLRLLEVIPIRHNDTEFVIGSIETIMFDDQWISPDGALNLTAAGSLAVSGLDEYLEMQSLFRLSYAKPDRDVEEIGGTTV
jgi:flavin reductase (DIM6/NTAB) family NADH-FMN oxidoreductase RutF